MPPGAGGASKAVSAGAGVPPEDGAGTPRADWTRDEFAGEAWGDWLLGDPFRLVPRARSTVAQRFPRGEPQEGGYAGRRLMLTFDDGPFPDSTTRLLDILDREQVHAVFFLVGNRVEEIAGRRNGRRTVQRMAAAGHSVGNHSFSHPHLPSLGEDGWKQQILRAHAAIFSVVGYAPTLFRPPYGQVNSAIDRYLTYRGYTRVQWTYVADEFRGRTAPVMARGVLAQIRERERLGKNVGGILLLHDTHQRSVDCAEILIRRLKAENCALLEAGDDDLWRFAGVDDFFRPAGSEEDAANGREALPADPAVREEARRWCAEHEAALEEIRKLDNIEVDLNESGFGGADGYGLPVDEES
jgi:peptidoglycan/xylan/chitin deacetylase (PgdA/CDA1 family)